MPWLAACLLSATLLRAEAPPALPGMDPLRDNGRGFLTQHQRLPLRGYDIQGLLGLPADEQGMVLDRAVAAGFNAVSFDAPLIGPQGLSPELGKTDDAAIQRLGRLLEACELRRIYAFPVLWTPATVDALIGTAAARVNFFAGKNALGWQAWALRQAAKVTVRGTPLTSTACVGGILLYRGPWPDAPPLPGRVVSLSPTAEARLRAWARWQVASARRMGYRQRLGLGLWAKQDLGAQAAPSGDVEVASDGAAPFAPLSDPGLKVDSSVEHAKALDVLPPVPGADAEFVGGTLDDSDEVKSAPVNPWDLEGLDWDVVDGLFQSLPMASQLDFIELTLDTEDWYRVGDRLAEAASKAEVPILWRQDWRTASRYERNKRLAPPPPLAGLLGGWPEDDWPAAGESLWPLHDAPSPETAPFFIRSARLVKEGGQIRLLVQLNRPADLQAWYGSGLPLKTVKSQAKARPKAEHSLALAGVAPGSTILIKIEAVSDKHGSALMRTRWVVAPK